MKWRQLNPKERRCFGLAFTEKARTDSMASEEIEEMQHEDFDYRSESLYFQLRMSEISETDGESRNSGSIVSFNNNKGSEVV
jgi:hypothetical protein